MGEKYLFVTLSELFRKIPKLKDVISCEHEKLTISKAERIVNIICDEDIFDYYIFDHVTGMGNNIVFVYKIKK